MAHIAFLAPILPGKLDAWRRFAQELDGTRKKDWTDFNKRCGITVHRAFLQQTDKADLVIVVTEGDGNERMMSYLAESDGVFETWFKKQILDIHGFDPAKMTGGPPSKLLIDYTS